MKSITVFVMLDACRFDYISKENTPFLHSVQLTGLSTAVKPTFGFEPDAAYLAGLFPDQANGGAQFWYYPEESPFKPARFLPDFCDKLPDLAQKVIRKFMVKAVRLSNSSPNLSTARLPFNMMHQFALPLKHSLDHPEFCSESESIFDLLRQNNRKWLYHASPEYKVNINAACRRAENDLKPPLEFAFFHIGDLDGVGHKFGPDSDEINQELVRVDKGLQNIHQIAAKRFDEVHFVVMGDHGMVRVDRTVDIQEMLRSLPLSVGSDYMYILDSTMARFWFFSEKAMTLITQKILQQKGGHVIGQDEKDRYHLNYTHNRFGELIFLADPGSLVFPNHYQSNLPEKGMHGYSPDCFGQQAVLLIRSEKVQQSRSEHPADMRQVFPTVCDLLDISIPTKCDPTSLLEAKP